MQKTRHLVYMSLLVALALVLHLIERNIPVPFMTPGAKLGLANLVTVLALYTMPRKSDVIKIIVARLFLSSIFGGSVSGLMYGSMGAVFSFIIMIVIKDGLKEKVSIIGVSAAGAVFHNIGQLLVAAFIVKNIGVMLYLPVLSIAGIVTGIFVGMAANYVIEHINKLPIFRDIMEIEKRDHHA